MKTLNFITKNVNDDDKDLFFGPLSDDDTFIIIEDHWNMAHILHQAGIFPSVTQARKNGWDKPIPEGFTFITVGKKAKKKDLFIFSQKNA